MTASRVSQLARVAFLALPLVAVAGTGLAQQAPTPLFSLPAADDKPAAEMAPATQPAAPGGGGIEVDSLTMIAPDSVGVLEPEAGGLGLDLWQGSDYETMTDLLRLLPGELRSPVLRDLARRVLLSSAAPPVGAPAADADGRPASDLLVLRAERLLALGQASDLAELLRLVPQAADERQAVARLRVESALLSGETEIACRRIYNGLTRFSAAAFWQKATILCQIVDDDAAAASLGLELLREAGDEDGDFAALVGTLLGYREPPEAPATTALNLGLIERLPAAAAVAALGDDPGLQAVAAAWPDLDPDRRVLLAEAALRGGALSPAELAERYAAIEFGAAELDSALSIAPTLGGPRGRALLYQAAARQRLAAARAEALRVALQQAAADGVEIPMMRAVAPLLVQIPPLPELAWFAPQAARVLILTGAYERASAWLRELRQRTPGAEQARPGVVPLWPLVRLVDADTATRAYDLAGWRAAAEAAGLDAAASDRQLILLQTALQAQGTPPELPWRSLAGLGAPERLSVASAALFALREAAAGLRRGETVLLTLRLLGDAAAADHPLALDEAMTALRRVGLDKEALALAVESLAAEAPSGGPGSAEAVEAGDAMGMAGAESTQ